jgi:hypothetical protein
MGPQPMFHKLGLSVVNFVDPFIILLPQQPSPTAAAAAASVAGSSWASGRLREVHVVIAAPAPSISLTSRLTHIDYQRREKRRYDDHVLQQRERPVSRASNGGGRQSAVADDEQVRVEFVVRLPESGLYRFEIFAVVDTPSSAANCADEDDDEVAAASRSRAADNLIPVYHYVIDHRDDAPAAKSGEGPASSNAAPRDQTAARWTTQLTQPFPHQTDLWRMQGCVLHRRRMDTSPGDKMLQFGSDVRPRKRTVVFRLEVPRADRIAVIVGDGQWHYLEHRPAAVGDTTLQLWHGEVELPSDDGGGHKRDVPSHDSRGSHERVQNGPPMVKVEVCAHYPQGTASFQTLLEYSAEI